MNSRSPDLLGHPDLAAALELRLDSLLAEVLARLEEKVEASSLPIDSWRALVRMTLERELGFFANGGLPAEVPLLEGPALAELTEAGELDLILATVRLSQSVLWASWFAEVEAAPGLSAEERRELLAHGSEFFFRCAALASENATAAYHEASDRLPDDNRRRRLRAVRAVLDRQSLAGYSEHLNYDLDQHHLGVIAWGEEAAGAVASLIGRLERPSMVLKPLDGLIWAWISGSRPFEGREEKELSRFKPPALSAIAIGEADFGECGFRATHRQAQQARWASRFDQQPLVRYADVAVLALAAADRSEARRFVAHELHGIDDENTDSRRIRETIAAYFASDHNAASAAARLSVHQQTVANRLRVAEERLGYAVGTRRLEIELALRLRACLGGSDSQ